MSESFPQDWVMRNLGESLMALPKSKLPSGLSDDAGYYNFYVCSSKVLKSFHKEMSSPAILLSTGGEASVHFATGLFSYSTDVWAVNFDGGICNEYAFRILEKELQNISYAGFQGSGIKHLDKSFIQKINVCVPPLAEQKKIASILASVDEVIENTQNQIDKLQDLKKATMNELLTKGIGHIEFKHSELGRIPQSWKVQELGDLIVGLKAGVSVNSENRVKRSNEIGILKTSSISQGTFFPQEHKTVLPSEILRVSTPVEKDAIIFSRMNTPNLVGEVGYVTEDVQDLYLPDRLWLINVRDTKKTFTKWLSWLLVSKNLRKQISDIATGTSGSMKNISKSALLSLKIAVPEFDQQKEIAKVIDSIDEHRKILTDKLSQTQAFKKSLMQDLLTGKVRVQVN